jgi:hypothetical protein
VVVDCKMSIGVHVHIGVYKLIGGRGGAP